MYWKDVSEICLGLILSNKLDPAYVNPQSFASPYGEAVKLLIDGADISILYDKIGMPPVKSALDAAKTVSDMNPNDAVTLLEYAAAREELASVLEKQISKLRKGEDADISKIQVAMERNENHEHKYKTMDGIDPEDVVWVKTGYKPFDEYIGGIPDANMTLIGAGTGQGKTSLLLRLSECFAKQGKKSLLYSLEMTSGQVSSRMRDVAPDVTDEEKRLITVCSDYMNEDEISAEAGRICGLEKMAMVGVDYAELMIEGAEDEPRVAKVYRTMAQLAKKINTPVILLAQLNRKYMERGGGEPRLGDFRWSGAAEHSAALALLIYNPSTTFSFSGKASNLFPIYPGKAWIIVAKSRFGSVASGGSPLGISVVWDGKTAWGKEDSSYKTVAGV